MPTTSSVLEMIAEREQAARAQAEYLRAQIDQLAGQLRELEGHRH
jgi:prefoldin subunit 5